MRSMSKFFSQLLFFFFILLTGYACAGQNSLTATYPAPQASYTKIILVNQSNVANICGTTFAPANNGAVFVVPGSGLLETCVNGSAVTSLQGCFNRFCSSAPCPSNAVACPCASTPNPATLCSSAGSYTQAVSQGNPIQDTFLTGSTNGAAPYYWTTSVVCCQTTVGTPSLYSPT